MFFAMAAGNGVIFMMGAAYLATFVGLKSALFLGILPFLLGDFIKLLLCARSLNYFIGIPHESCGLK